MQTETGDGGAPWTGRAVGAFGINAVTANRNPAAGLWAMKTPNTAVTISAS